MENHIVHPALFLLCAAIIVANSAELEPSYENKNSYSLSYNPQPHEFPNEQLYHAYVVIQRFKNTISCDPKNITTTWIGQDVCGDKSYRGFYCATPSMHGANLTLAAVDFGGFGLCAPNLRGFIDQLPDLAIFQATSNNFNGDIPRLSGLPKYSLEVKDDFKSSKQDIQPVLGERHCIYASANSLKVPIFCKMYSPSVLQKAVQVSGTTDDKVLLLSNNKLSGAIPMNLGFSKLSYLALANNKLTGPIPPSIAEAQDTLNEVLLLNNQLSGCLPHELGMLHKATVIDAGMNQLTGPIPSSFSCLSSVEQLNLAGNRLYGQVPDALCKLAGPAGRLANLTLSGNYFSSVGPACATLMKYGVLDVKNNCIPGLANQRRPAECAAFQSQPKSCPATSTHQVACPAAAANDAAAPAERKVRDYSDYVTYATLHD